MVRPRSSYELKLMKESGRITSLALKKVLSHIKPGVTTLELDRIAEKEIKDAGGKIAFITVDDYNWATCITVNEQVVHGIPTERQLKIGDVVSIDLGTIYRGWFTDSAWSVVLGKDKDSEHFLKVGEEALWLGIKQAVKGNRIGDIANAIQTKVESAGYSVVRSLVGHGVGRELHEEPEVPGYGKAGTGMILKEGMSLAIEVIYKKGSPEVIVEDDGWTISSADGALSGLFEMTVIVGKSKAEVLTDWRKL